MYKHYNCKIVIFAILIGYLHSYITHIGPFPWKQIIFNRKCIMNEDQCLHSWALYVKYCISALNCGNRKCRTFAVLFGEAVWKPSQGSSQANVTMSKLSTCETAAISSQTHSQVATCWVRKHSWSLSEWW